MWRNNAFPKTLPALVALLALAGCGDLPQPFRGNPGALGRQLARPPAARLAVAPPTSALLPDSAADTWAGAVADALVAAEMPAVSGMTVRPGDWRLVLAADMRNGQVVPSYTVLDPRGREQGVTEGTPVDPARWASGDPAVLKQVAAQSAAGISTMMGRIEAARQQSDPNSLVNRPARLYLTGITGAPGDGNTALNTQIRAKLAGLGMVVQDTDRSADFSFKGEVATAPGADRTVRVEVQWIVFDPAGVERGRILQLNEVPPATIATYWGDVATAVATEAAGGIRDVVLTQAGVRKPGS